MNFIAKNEELIKKLGGKSSLISSTINAIHVLKDRDAVIIEVDFTLMYNNTNNEIKLRFLDVQEYLFYYNSDNIFYNIERLKFLKLNTDIYIRFDPSNEEERRSEDDQDYILSKDVEGFWILGSTQTLS